MNAFALQSIWSDRVVSGDVCYTFTILKQLLLQSVGGHLGRDYDYLLDKPFPVAISQLETWVELQEDIKKHSERNDKGETSDSRKGQPKDLSTVLNKWGFKIQDLQEVE